MKRPDDGRIALWRDAGCKPAWLEVEPNEMLDLVEVSAVDRERSSLRFYLDRVEARKMAAALIDAGAELETPEELAGAFVRLPNTQDIAHVIDSHTTAGVTTRCGMTVQGGHHWSGRLPETAVCSYCLAVIGGPWACPPAKATAQPTNYEAIFAATSGDKRWYVAPIGGAPLLSVERARPIEFTEQGARDFAAALNLGAFVRPVQPTPVQKPRNPPSEHPRGSFGGP